MKSFVAVFLFTSCFFVQAVLSKTDDSTSQLCGLVDGIDVVLEKAVFADKVLKIKTKGKDGFKANLSVHLPIENGVVPELKKFSNNGKAAFRKRVKVSYYWKELASGKTVHSFMKRGEYRVEVEFGKEMEGFSDAAVARIKVAAITSIKVKPARRDEHLIVSEP